MAISPKEVFSITKMDEQKMLEAEQRLDLLLKRAADSGSRSIYLDVDVVEAGLSKRLIEGFLDRYRAVGWSIERKGDQRDGDFYIFCSSTLTIGSGMR